MIGAGPAGAIAAAGLAGRGLDVALIDPGPRNGPVIGETLPAIAAEMLARHGFPGPLDDPIHMPISGTISAWDGPTVTQSSLDEPGGTAWRLDRSAFDAALVSAAKDAGAKLVTDTVMSVRQDDGLWHLTTDGETLTAGMVVDASGRRAVLGRALNLPRHRQDRQIAVWAVGAICPEPRTSKTLIEGLDGEWWYGAVLPSGNPIAALHCSVERALTIRRQPRDWHVCLAKAEILASRLCPEVFAEASLQFTEASGNAAVTPAGQGWVACGDAAIAFDPMAAQGLLNAVRTGLAVPDALTGGAEGRSRYCAELRDVWSTYAARHEVLKARLRLSAMKAF